MSIIAIIPARGGSKRIPKKNIKLFSGKPIISYSIKAAKKTRLFNSIIVSTDSEEITEVATSFGALAPFRRPVELSDDYADTVSVLLHTLKWLKRNDHLPEYFCCMYATAPFIRPADIKRGFELLRKKDAATVFPVTSFAYPIFRALKINDNGHLEMFWPDYLDTRSQDLPEAYHDAGQFYWANTHKFLQEKKMYTQESIPLILNRRRVQDIDTPDDWVIAEQMYKALNNEASGK